MFRVEIVEDGKLLAFDLAETKIAGTVATKLNREDLIEAMRAENIPDMQSHWGWQQAATHLAKHRLATKPVEKLSTSWEAKP
jgi:hypothetical protein